MSLQLHIRDAVTSDAKVLAEIYNPYVLESTATFDTEPKTADERASWVAERAIAHPVLVAEDKGQVVAWGALSRYSERPAWNNTVEISVYVRPGRTGAGVGPAMIASLVERARSLGHHAIVARIVSGNDASAAITRRAGFEHVGTLREVGRKFDRWLDVEMYELIL